MMRSKFSIFALFLVVIFFATDSLAQQPGCPSVESVRREHLDADDYAELQQNAPEQLQIIISKVLVRRVHQRNSILPIVQRGLPPVLKVDYVEIEATVTDVKRSKFGLKKNSSIEIYYITNKNYTIGDLDNWEAISPLLMEVNKEYKVFLKRVQVQTGTDTDDGYRYVPVAYSKSFAEVKVETESKNAANW